MGLIITKMKEALNSHVRRVQVIYIWDKYFVKKCNIYGGDAAAGK